MIPDIGLRVNAGACRLSGRSVVNMLEVHYRRLPYECESLFAPWRVLDLFHHGGH